MSNENKNEFQESYTLFPSSEPNVSKREKLNLFVETGAALEFVVPLVQSWRQLTIRFVLF